MNEHRWWWPVALDDAAAGPGSAGPAGVTLFGQALVLWHAGGGGAVGAPVLMDDRCSHRGASLSLGKVVACAAGPALQCSYHGWQFGPNGRCVAIPAVPGFSPPATHVVRRYGVQAAHGLLWADLGGAAHGPPALDGLPPRRLVYGPFDVATSAPRAVENFLDTAHFAFVHAGWLGDAVHPTVPHYEVVHTADGRPVVEHYRAWQPRASASAAGGDSVDYRYEVLSPYSALLAKRPLGGGPQDAYVIWACPTQPEACRLWFAQYTSDEATPADVLRDFQVAIFAQDQPVLESQRPRLLPLSGGEVMSAADRLSAAYRRYLREQGITFGVC